MPTAEQVRDLTFETLEIARGRADDLAAAVNRAADEMRERSADIELPSIEVPSVDDLVGQATRHRVRSTLLLGALVLGLVLIIRKAVAGSDEPATDTAN